MQNREASDASDHPRIAIELFKNYGHRTVPER